MLGNGKRGGKIDKIGGFDPIDPDTFSRLGL